MAQYLSEIFPESHQDIWHHRVRRWLNNPSLQFRIVLILDGLNEQPETHWLQIVDQLLTEEDQPYQAGFRPQSAKKRTAIPTIITCRTGYWQEHLARLQQWNPPPFLLEGFSDDELRAYLRRAGRELSTIDRAVRELLRVPRLCDLVITHHDCLVESGDLTVERLLYEDWRNREGRKNDFPLLDHGFRRIMSVLAEEALAGKDRYLEHELRQYLPLKDTVRAWEELKTGGVFDEVAKGRYRVNPTRLHHALGLLLLAEVTRAHAESSAAELSEIIHKHLSPAGLDAHAPICAAAIFGSTVQDTPEEVVRLLFETFFGLQNLPDDEWQRIRGYFPAFPEVYRQLAERLSFQERSSQRAWQVIEWAYLRWADELRLRQTLEGHCHRWLSMVSLTSHWHPEDKQKQEEYQHRLEGVLGMLSPGVTKEVHGQTFQLVSTSRVTRLHYLAFSILSALPSALAPSLLTTWALSSILQNTGHAEASARWLVRLFDVDTNRQLESEIKSLLRVEHPVWQRAAFHLASMLPDQRAKTLMQNSSYQPRKSWQDRASKDACDTGAYLWQDKDCLHCLARDDISPADKARNLAFQATAPSFLLPPKLEEHLTEDLRILLDSLDQGELHTGQPTSTYRDLERWEKAFLRWIPEEYARFVNSKCELFKVPSTAPEGTDEKRNVPYRLENIADDLESAWPILKPDSIETLRSFWSSLVRGAPKKQFREDSQLIHIERSLFSILLATVSPETYEQLVFGRPLDLKTIWMSFIDAQPTGPEPEEVQRHWEQLLELSDEEINARLLLFAREPIGLEESGRNRLAQVEHQHGKRFSVAGFAVASGDRELINRLIRDRDEDLVQAFYDFGTPDSEVTSGVPLDLLGRIPAPLLSHLLQDRTDTEAVHYLATEIREFLGRGLLVHSHFPGEDLERAVSFSTTALRRVLDNHADCVEALLAEFHNSQGQISPVEHSFWLYFAFCEYLLSCQPEQAILVLDALVAQKLVQKKAPHGVHAVIGLMARFVQNEDVALRLVKVLDLCTDDLALQGIAHAFEPDVDDWLWQRIEEDVTSDRPMLVARGFTLAGFAHDCERGVAFLETQSAESWLEHVRINALKAARQACRACHWFQEFLDRGSVAGSWSAFQLFSECTDRRYLGMANALLASSEFSYRDGSAKLRYLRMNNHRLHEAVKKRERDHHLKRFCHMETNDNLFPWMKQWRLSPEDQRRLIIG